MQTFNEIKAMQDAAFARLSDAGIVLDSFPKGLMGMTTDGAKSTAAYQQACAERNSAMNQVQAIGALISKHFKKENSAYIQNERLKKLQVA